MIELADFVSALADLPDDSLESVLSELTTSVAKLDETNEILAAEVASTRRALEARDDAASRNDLALYTATIAENNEVVVRQKQRIEALQRELQRRGKPQSVYL
ncbi:Uncharacterized protein ABC855_g3271 [[Candida] zeylanoides]